MNLVRILERIKQDEGFRSKSYWDDAKGGGGGQWTWGYGTPAPGPNKTISKVQAELELLGKVNYFIRVFRKWFAGIEMDETREEALVNMMFNLGVTRFKLFKEMDKAIREGNWDRASEEAKNSLWYSQVPKRAERIVAELKTGKGI